MGPVWELSRKFSAQFTGQQTLSILLWSDESQMLRGFDVPYYHPSTYSISPLPSLTLSLSSSLLTFPPPRSFLCIFTHPSCHIHSICLFSVSLSSYSLLSSLKSECLSHASGNKQCQVCLKGGVCVCRSLMQVLFTSVQSGYLCLSMWQKNDLSHDAAYFNFKVKYMYSLKEHSTFFLNIRLISRLPKSKKVEF